MRKLDIADFQTKRPTGTLWDMVEWEEISSVLGKVVYRDFLLWLIHKGEGSTRSGVGVDTVRRYLDAPDERIRA